MGATLSQAVGVAIGIILRTPLQKALIPICATASATAVGVARRHVRNKRSEEIAFRIAQADERVKAKLVELETLAKGCATHEATSQMAKQVADGFEKLAQISRRTGTDLQDAFSPFAADRKHDLVGHPSGDFFRLWHDIGENNAGFSTRLLDLNKSLVKAAADADERRISLQAEGECLRKALVEAEAETPISAKPSTVVGWIFGCADVDSEKEEQRMLRLQNNWSETSASLQALASKLDADCASSSASITDAVTKAQSLMKPLGINPEVKKARSNTVGKNIDKMIKTLSTAEARQQHKAEEDAAEASKPAPAVDAPIHSAPVENIGNSIWRIKGIYEHQVLKIGLRRLEETWISQGVCSDDQLQQMPKGLFRARLLGDLVAGRISLQAVTGNDVATAQRDLQSLSLPQLLRLRILHLDFTPSGCGSNTVSAVGGTHEAFLSTLDKLLFRQLGKKALGDLIGETPKDLPDEHKAGRDAILLVAAAASVSASPWWCWWVTDEQRVFFHATSFTALRHFLHAEGALQITDYSKADKHEPTGRLRWFDWRVELVTRSEDLSDAPLRGQHVPVSATLEGRERAGTERERAGTELDSNYSLDASPKASTGAATASMLSPELLRGVRGSLRKTGTGTFDDSPL